jgi:hypothetical protein
LNFPFPTHLLVRSAGVWCPQLFCIHAFRRTAIRNLINMFVCHTGQKFQNVVSLDWKYWWFVQFAWTQTLTLNMYCFRVTVAVIDSSMQVPKPFKKKAHWDVLPPSVLQHVNKYIIQSLLNMFPKCCRSMDVFNARQWTIIWVHLLKTYLSISWNVRNYLYARQWYFNIVKFNLLFDFAVTCTMLEKITWKGELTFDAILGSRKTFSSHSVFLALLPFLMLWPSALLWIARLECLICEQCFKLC